MSLHREQISTLLAEIDGVLNKASPRLPWVMSSEVNQQRQTLEHLRRYLANLQAEGAMDSYWPSPLNAGVYGTDALPLTSLEVPQAHSTTLTQDPMGSQDGVALSQQMLQRFAQDLGQLRSSLLQPLGTEINRLQQQRDSLLQEIRQLERQRQQYNLVQQRASQEQLMHEFLQGLMERLQERLSQHVTQVISSMAQGGMGTALGDGGGSLTPVFPQEQQLPPLPVAQRLEQVQMLQSRADQMMVTLDTTLRVFSEALQQNIQSYESSLAQGLERMHSMGQQGEAIVTSLVEKLADQVSSQVPLQGANARLAPSKLPPPLALQSPVRSSFGTPLGSPGLDRSPSPIPPKPSHTGVAAPDLDDLDWNQADLDLDLDLLGSLDPKPTPPTPSASNHTGSTVGTPEPASTADETNVELDEFYASLFGDGTGSRPTPSTPTVETPGALGGVDPVTDLGSSAVALEDSLGDELGLDLPSLDPESPPETRAAVVTHEEDPNEKLPSPDAIQLTGGDALTAEDFFGDLDDEGDRLDQINQIDQTNQNDRDPSEEAMPGTLAQEVAVAPQPPALDESWSLTLDDADLLSGFGESQDAPVPIGVDPSVQSESPIASALDPMASGDLLDLDQALAQVVNNTTPPITTTPSPSPRSEAQNPVIQSLTDLVIPPKRDPAPQIPPSAPTPTVPSRPVSKPPGAADTSGVEEEAYPPASPEENLLVSGDDAREDINRTELELEAETLEQLSEDLFKLEQEDGEEFDPFRSPPTPQPVVSTSDDPFGVFEDQDVLTAVFQGTLDQANAIATDSVYPPPSPVTTTPQAGTDADLDAAFNDAAVDGVGAGWDGLWEADTAPAESRSDGESLLPDREDAEQASWLQLQQSLANVLDQPDFAAPPPPRQEPTLPTFKGMVDPVVDPVEEETINIEKMASFFVDAETLDRGQPSSLTTDLEGWFEGDLDEVALPPNSVDTETISGKSLRAEDLFND